MKHIEFADGVNAEALAIPPQPETAVAAKAMGECVA
jgi:hypothetical protein